MGNLNVTRKSDKKSFFTAQVEVETYEEDARARRIITVDSSGNVIKATQISEDILGSECSGVDGTKGRVLTLQNTNESGNPVAIWVEDQLINSANYTVSHLSSSSTITFDNINIFDLDTIHVNYQI